MPKMRKGRTSKIKETAEQSTLSSFGLRNLSIQKAEKLFELFSAEAKSKKKDMRLIIKEFLKNSK